MQTTFSPTARPAIKSHFKINDVSLFYGDAMNFYKKWDSPIVIISDGPYGVSGYPGDTKSAKELAKWYEPHIAEWSKYSSPQTTLWFWNTEVGWASVHPILEKYGWQYRVCNVWNKGIGHIAGNVNTGKIRKLPVVTEVCVQYIKEARFIVDDNKLSMSQWLIAEWKRTKLPFRKTNEACGVKDAATRKYFTASHLWYFPPVEAFQKIVDYANKFGDPKGRPYFSIDGKKSLTASAWEKMRSKFYCEHGITNVWEHPPVRGLERLKNSSKCMHSNQKPLKLTELIIRLSSDERDVVWDPFGGLCTGGVASLNLKRKCFSAEINLEYFKLASERLENFAGGLFARNGHQTKALRAFSSTEA